MTKEYWINVKHVDNRLVIFLNGETIWDSGIVHEDPDMDVYINITSRLMEHINDSCELIFEGFNDHYDHNNEEGLNNWHFEYRVFTRAIDAQGTVVEELNMLAPYNEKHLSNPNIRAINNVYKIVRKDNDFKVVSNALSQNFYA